MILIIFFFYANLILASESAYNEPVPVIPEMQVLLHGSEGSILELKTSGNNLNSKSQMDEIIIQLLNAFKKNMTVGFPDLGIPVLDPLLVEFIALNITDPMLTLNGTIKNLEVVGLSKFNIISVTSDFPRLQIDLLLTFDSIKISGHYDVDGKAAQVLPIFGKGTFNIAIADVTLLVGCKLTITANGGIYLEELRYQIQLKKLQVDIEGLLGGGEIGDQLNEIINTHGISMLNRLESKFHDKLVAGLLSYVNKLLECIKLTDILGSSSPINNIIGSLPFPPTILTKPKPIPDYFPFTRADASEYVDYVLANLREYMIFNGLDKIPLKNQTEKFSDSFLGITWYGEASLFNGVLTGLETIHRSGPTNLNMENHDIVFDAELEVNDAGLKYAMSAQFMGFGPSATVIGNLQSIKVFIKCRVSAGLSNVTLDEFKVVDLGHLSIDVYGLGALDFIVGIIADIVGNSVKGLVAEMLEGTIKSMLNEIIGDLLFPVKNNSPRLATVHLHPYHRSFVFGEAKQQV